MQLGFHTAILPDLTLEQVFEVATRFGYECVEACCWPVGKATRRYAGVTHIDVESLSDSKIAEIQKLSADTGIGISTLGYYPNALSVDADEAAKAQEHLVKVIDASAALGINCVCTFVGRDHTKTVDDQWSRFIDVWTPLIEQADKQGVQIGIENCPMTFTADEWPGGKNLASTPAVWRRMFEAFPTKNFGLNYDPSHFVWQQMDEIAPLRDFADRIVHLHAKDVRLHREKLEEVGPLAFPNLYHSPKLPGLGEVDWPAFFSALGDMRYDGPVVVEVEDRSYEGSLEARIASLEQSARFLRNFITAH